LAGGLVLGVCGALPWLLRRVRAVRGGGTTATVAVGDRWGQVVTLALAVDHEGTVLALPWQWPLAADLLRGRLNLWGDRARIVGTAGDAVAGTDLLDFWRAEPAAPGLTGPWARPAAWRRLWRDPGGFGRVDQAVGAPHGRVDQAAPGGEAGETCETES
jgi:hypothetical protein